MAFESEFKGVPVDYVPDQPLTVGATTDLTVAWKQIIRRLFIQNLSGGWVRLKLEGTATSATSFDVYLLDGESFSLSDLLISKVTVHGQGALDLGDSALDFILRGWGVPAS